MKFFSFFLSRSKNTFLLIFKNKSRTLLHGINIIFFLSYSFYLTFRLNSHFKLWENQYLNFAESPTKLYLIRVWYCKPLSFSLISRLPYIFNKVSYYEHFSSKIHILTIELWEISGDKVAEYLELIPVAKTK